MNNEILVYAQQLTPRVKYAVEVLLRDLLSLQVSFTSDKESFIEFHGSKISYSYQPVCEALNFVPHGLLFERGIEQFDVHVFETDLGKGMFKVNESPFEFDVFSATFYLVTRYEEYLPHVKDKHGRFSAKHSIAYKNDFLIQPIVNQWAQVLQKILEQNIPSLNLSPSPKKFSVNPTIDVDSAFAFKHKGLVRTIAGCAKDVFSGEFNALKHRVSAILGKVSDPFDVFDQLIKYQNQYGWRFTYFFLVGDYDKNDKNISITSRKFQSVIKHVNDYSSVGLHPSFASNENKAKLVNEVNRLSGVLHYPVKSSRQHFLKLHLPATYRNLLELGITDDYSMGYPEESGFRASICSPFYFYDLELEVETNLLVHPFCFMEATYKYYHPKNPQEMTNKAVQFAKTVQQVNGEFCFVWHSDSISGEEPWKGWEGALEKTLFALNRL